MTTIKLTQFYIDNGKRRSCRECPIALAILDVLDTGVSIKVDHGSIRLKRYHDLKSTEVMLPKAACGFIALFDRQYEVSPFDFELDIPAQYLK